MREMGNSGDNWVKLLVICLELNDPALLVSYVKFQRYFKICLKGLFCRASKAFLCLALLVIFKSQVECNASEVKINLTALAQVESSGNPKAVNKSDNKGIGSYGLHQVSPYALADFNKAHKTAFKPSDLLQAELSTRVAEWYINQEIPRLIAYYAKRNHKIRDSVESRLTAYNQGIGNLLKGRVASRYIARYKAEL